MSKNTERLWTLGVIVNTIQRLNDQRGSRVSEIIWEMVKGTQGETDPAVFDVQCRKFEAGFGYGIVLDILVPDEDCERYKIGMSAPDVFKFLKSLDKSPEPKPVEEKKCKPKAIFLEIDDDCDDLDYDRFKTVEKKRINSSTTNLKIFTVNESSDDSSCEII